MLKIIQAPHPVLSKKAKSIEKIDATIKRLIDEMTKTLENAKDPEGVGLAAPQVGKSLRLFIVKESKSAPLRVFINPELKVINSEEKLTTKQTERKSKEIKLEGCLSLRDIWGVVKRHKKIEVTYLDEKGEKHTEIFNGFLATIIQHEQDHLEGILFPQRVLEQNGTLYKSKINKKGEMEFHEISI